LGVHLKKNSAALCWKWESPSYNSSVGIRDFIHALRTSTHSALSASCVVHNHSL